MNKIQRNETIVNSALTRGGTMNQKVSGEERLAAICQALRQETLSPAQQEAEALILTAKREAELIIEQSKKEIDSLKKMAKREIEKEKDLFHSSLKHASRQIVDSLKEQIETILFQKGIDCLVKEQLQSTEQLSSLMAALIDMVQKEGLNGSPEIWLGKAIDKKSYLAALTKHVLAKPLEETIQVGSFNQGFKLIIQGQHMSIEVTEESVRELLTSLLKRDFRKYLFQEPNE
jgi:V/A-type H+-transporting ATPase subunit E